MAESLHLLLAILDEADPIKCKAPLDQPLALGVDHSGVEWLAIANRLAQRNLLRLAGLRSLMGMVRVIILGADQIDNPAARLHTVVGCDRTIVLVRNNGFFRAHFIVLARGATL